MFRQTDLRFSKRTRIVGRTDFELAAEMLNAFNQANFVPVGIGNSGATQGNTIANYEVTDADGHQHLPRHPAGHAVELVDR